MTVYRMKPFRTTHPDKETAPHRTPKTTIHRDYISRNTIRERGLVFRYTTLFMMGHEWLFMSGDRANAESKVSGNQANIPARIRRELDIDDGDHLRWQIEDDGSVRVHVIQQKEGTFGDFDGYEGEIETNVTTDHDAWGIDPE